MSLLNDSEYEQLSELALEDILNAAGVLEKGRAIFELARRSRNDEKRLKIVLDRINNSQNLNSRTVGIVSISHWGVAGLLEANTPRAREAVQMLLDRRSEPDRSNLIDFLESASLMNRLR
ncbi:MAG: hypothetical protein SWY16_21970 [Cyanobacteriota bacterium]|nr:hypothetical protein [Cyanobacteriota bacterium]